MSFFGNPRVALLCICLFGIFLNSCHSVFLNDPPPPKLVSINIIDRNGLTEIVSSPERLEKYEQVNFLEPQPYQKVLRVYSRDEQGNIHAFITSYHDNGFPKQYLEVINSQAYGAYREWYPNGVLRIDTNVISGTADIVNGAEQTWSFDGECLVRNDKGELEATFSYSKGDLEGLATYYHPCGTPWKVISYHKNKIEGTLKIFLENGELFQQLEYCDGLKDGPALRYWDPEHLSSEEMFADGLLVNGYYYDPSGALICQVNEGNGFRALFGEDYVCELQQYRAGFLDGEVKTFNEKNRITALFHVKNGFKHGEEILYYDLRTLQPTPIPKISINWYDGQIQGMVKTWYDNGVQESQKEMSTNKKNGHSTAWYRDGSLMMIEEYDFEKLVKGEYYTKGEKLLVGEVRNGKGTAMIYDSEGTFIRKINYEHGIPQLDRS